MKSLKWEQVNGWRLSQHSLAKRLKGQDFIKAVTQTGGIQAQGVEMRVPSVSVQAAWGGRGQPPHSGAVAAVVSMPRTRQ